MMATSEIAQLLYHVQLALLQHVTGNLRWVGCRQQGATVEVAAVFSQPLTPEEVELMQMTETEIIASYPDSYEVRFSVHVVDGEERLLALKQGFWSAYFRYEPWMGFFRS